MQGKQLEKKDEKGELQLAAYVVVAFSLCRASEFVESSECVNDATYEYGTVGVYL
jgi:hypothetical protein